MTRILLSLTIVLAVAAAVGVWQRHRIIVPLATTGEPVPAVKTAATIEDGEPFGEDAYFVVVKIDELTYAIAEPRSWANNFNYLLIGENRALLFDAGVGHYDIRPVVRSLTDLPLTFMPSHFHYDHTGQGEWERIAIVDVPHLREQAVGDTLALSWEQHMGSAEAVAAPIWTVGEWIKPGSVMDLGGRELVLLYTPGHTDNSVSLYDKQRQMMFTGDFITASGVVTAFLPKANLGDFLQSANKVLNETETRPETRFRGAHSDDKGTIPNLERMYVKDVRDTLERIKSGEAKPMGVYPVNYTINESMVFVAEPPFLQDWTPTYPDGHEVHQHGRQE